jgi:hypothetical protein
MVQLMWVVAAFASLTAARKHEYFEDGVVDRLNDFVVVILLVLLCCCGKFMNCLVQCCHRADDNMKPLLTHCHNDPRLQHCMGELGQSPMYITSKVPPLFDRSQRLVYPYLTQ